MDSCVSMGRTAVLFSVFFNCISLFRIHTGRVRTKQPLSTASSVSSQVDSRGRSRTKMVSQSQRTYPSPFQWHTQDNPAVSQTVWVSGPFTWTYTPTEQWELLAACVCSFWSFITCCLNGDDKLHVNVFVPSGSDESDCTPGILFVCQSVCVCVYLCTTVGMVAHPLSLSSWSGCFV